MESISNAAQNTFNAQGVPQQQQQHGDEPMSGVQGKGTISDPYDAGNRDEQLGAPINKDNSGYMTQPPTSTGTGTNISSFSDQYHNAYARADPITSDVSGSNTSIERPAPVAGDQYNMDPAAKNTSQPLASTGTGTNIGTFNDQYNNPDARADPITSSSSNNSIERPAPVAGDQYNMDPAAKSTSQPLASTGTGTNISSFNDQYHNSNARADPVTSSGSSNSIERPAPVAGKESTAGSAAKQSTTGSSSTSSASGAGAGSVSGSAPGPDRQSEQRDQNKSQSQSQSQSQEQEQDQGSTNTGGSSESGGASTETVAQKHGVSEEALRGPDCPPPRQSYEKQMKDPNAGGEKEGDSKKSDNSNNNSKDSQGKDKNGDEHHHKSLKEKFSDMIHHHH